VRHTASFVCSLGRPAAGLKTRCYERRHNIVTADREPTVTLSQDPAKHTIGRLATEWV